jgi:DNA-binding MarR family transcriptional regulator
MLAPSRAGQHLIDLLTTLLSSTFRQILWKQALELDLTYSQAQVLFHLARNPKSPVTDVARTFGITLPAVTQVVDRLESKRFVERLENARDRRQVLPTLTRSGHALVRDLEAAQISGLSEGQPRVRLTTEPAVPRADRDGSARYRSADAGDCWGLATVTSRSSRE